MAGEGTITGQVNGDHYELVQNGTVRQRIPLSQIDSRMKAAIKRNKWERLS